MNSKNRRRYNAACDFLKFYIEKGKQSGKSAEDEIKKLQIVNFEIKENKLEITLRRPGILIGSRGQNITDLQKIVGLEIKIIEDDSFCEENLLQILKDIDQN